jgi:hypothetical protein
MTPKEKAIELRDKTMLPSGAYLGRKGDLRNGGYRIGRNNAKKCVSILCDEVIGALKKVAPDYEDKTYWHSIDYWEQVKQEIEKI